MSEEPKVPTMVYRKMRAREADVKNMHTTESGRFEYQIIEMSSPNDPIPAGFSRELDPKKDSE